MLFFAIKIRQEPTEIKVPGRKNRVTSVMILMDTVSWVVFCASSFISLANCSMLLVIVSILTADSCDLLAKVMLAAAFR